MNWQPIETAPMDGTHILVSYEGQGITEAWYEVEKSSDGEIYYQEWEALKLGQHGCGCCSYKDEDPTHWMPLLKQPEKQS